MNQRAIPRQGIYYALGAAVLFGASTPLAKHLTTSIEPQLLAGLLYAGAGIGLSVQHLLQKVSTQTSQSTSTFHQTDFLWLGLAILFGGIIGPVLLMVGLQTTPASNTSLLLNLESVFTTLLAWFLFREHFDRRIVWGMIAILCGSLLLSWSGRPEHGGLTGTFLIGSACLAWAIDNNVTRQISGSNSQSIAMWKGIGAGLTNLVIAFGLGAQLPALGSVIAALAIGWVGYGISLQLFVLALRHVGTARTGAYFGVAPFVGVALSLVFFRSEFTYSLIPATLLMAFGVWLHVSERHIHEHLHDPIEHDHDHEHDDHHHYDHDPSLEGETSHRHYHRHEPVLHSHPHFPDLHHRHTH